MLDSPSKGNTQQEVRENWLFARWLQTFYKGDPSVKCFILRLPPCFHLPYYFIFNITTNIIRLASIVISWHRKPLWASWAARTRPLDGWFQRQAMNPDLLWGEEGSCHCVRNSIDLQCLGTQVSSAWEFYPTYLSLLSSKSYPFLSVMGGSKRTLEDWPEGFELLLNRTQIRSNNWKSQEKGQGTFSCWPT